MVEKKCIFMIINEVIKLGGWCVKKSEHLHGFIWICEDAHASGHLKLKQFSQFTVTSSTETL